MRKIKLLLLSIILLPINAYALTGTISVNCTPSKPHPGDTIACTISGTSDSEVTSISAQFQIGSGASATSFQTTGGWEGNDINKNRIDVYTSNDISGNFNIGTLSVKIDDNASAGNISLNLSNVVYNDINDKEVSIANASTNIEVTTSSDQTPTPTAPPAVEKGLKELRCTSGGTLSPQLTDNNTGYAIILSSPETNSFAISAKAKNSSDEVVFKNADTGETLDSSNINFTTSGGKDTMLIKLYVGSGDNEVTYTIAVSKPVSERGALASLVVGGKSITLIEGKYDYQVALDNVDSYQIQATVKDSSKFEVDTSNISRMLNGENSYEITVRPKDNTSGYESSIYIVTVTKNGTKTPTPTVKPAPPSSNPQTGSGGVIAIGLILAISLGATIYMYKRNTLNSDTN